jgi:hypothetical protein
MTIFTLFMLVGLGVVISRSLKSTSDSPRTLVAPDAAIEIAGYRTWNRVNQTPFRMAPAAAAACAMAMPAGPHQDKYVTVYVNDLGRKAMLEQLKPKFPEGSIIVKEKLGDPSSQTPELLTVMIKRSHGYNQAVGDWEFMVTDGKGVEVKERGKLTNCQSCHASWPARDYIFRSYLPDDVANKLK